jgi:hypothetical protein
MNVKADRRSFLVHTSAFLTSTLALPLTLSASQVTDLEKQLGVYDLAQFTPK